MSDDDDDGSSGIMGKLIKYSLIIAVSIVFPPFMIFYFFWKYVKLCVKFYFKALYLIIRLPIWLFIQLPLHYLGVGMHATSNALSKAYGVIMSKKKRYGLLFGILFFLMLQAFLPRNVDAAISFITDATLILPFLVLIPFFITFLVALISAHYSNPNIARKDMPGGLDTGMKSGAATGAAAAATAGQVGMKAYNHKDEIEAAGKAAKGLAKGGAEAAEAAAEESVLAGDMLATLESMPLLGGMVGGEAAAGAGAAGTATAATGGTALAVILAALGLAVLGFIVISIILSALLWGVLMWLTSVLAPLMSPILGAIGLGQAYGNFFGSEVANNLLPQVDLTAEMRMVEQAGAKVGCALQGPACLRQWRLNNTARPGSEDVGEEYKLKVDEFSMGGQGGVDIAYKKPSYEIPTSFLLLNTRHGLKGIDANDVKWRVRIGDADRSGKKSYCSTGWQGVGDTVGGEGTILPGTSFSPRLNDLEDLTLQECEMLNPALGHDYTGELDVKYDYSSQSTLYVRAMSRKNMRDEDITPEFKKSETADTPVETFINVKEPITYIEESNTPEGQGMRSVPFTVKVGTNTDMYDVEYRVHADDFRVMDSSRTQTVAEGDEEGSCIGLESDNAEGENAYGLSDRTQDRMDARINPDDSSTWFYKDNNPTPARCTFELSDPGLISATGETLTMRVDANYTVVIEETSDPFEVKNTMCASGINCPVLFTITGEEFGELMDVGLPPDEEDRFTFEEDETIISEAFANYNNATCDGIDAGSDCTAVPEYQYRSPYSDANQTPIEEDEIAVEWTEETAGQGKLFSCGLRSGEGDFSRDAIGIPTGNELEEVKGTNSKVFKLEDGELEVEDYEEEISVEAFSSVPDWIAEAEYSETKTATGCRDGKPVYEINCRNIDVGGVASWTTTPTLALNVVGGSCTE